MQKNDVDYSQLILCEVVRPTLHRPYHFTQDEDWSSRPKLVNSSPVSQSAASHTIPLAPAIPARSCPPGAILKLLGGQGVGYVR